MKTESQSALLLLKAEYQFAMFNTESSDFLQYL